MKKDEPPGSSLVEFAPRPREFQERVRKLVADTNNIGWSRHALERMQERDISIRVALNVLREGIVVGNVEAGRDVGEWKAKIVSNVKGRRDVGVIAILVRGDRVSVNTVEWEDMR